MFEKIIEQDRVKAQLAAGIERQAISHALLFTGRKGIGKRMMAMEYAKALLCRSGDRRPCGSCPVCQKIDHGNHPDVQVIAAGNGETTIKISQIRKMLAVLPVKPYESSWRISIILEAERMTLEAQNALLKSLEEPEPHNLFILTAENPEKLLVTVRSRCQVLPFEPVSEAGIRRLLEAAGTYTAEEIANALYDCEGAPGRALSLLENTALEQLKNEALDVFYAILRGDTIRLFAFSEKMSKDKALSQEVLNFLIVWFHDMQLCLMGLKTPSGSLYEKQAGRFSQVLTTAACSRIEDHLFELLKTLQYNVNVRLQWESTLLKLSIQQEIR